MCIAQKDAILAVYNPLCGHVCMITPSGHIIKAQVTPIETI